MRKPFFIFLLLLAFSISAQTKNFSGVWKGYLTQPSNYGIVTKYPLTLTLDQKGDSVTGFEKIEGPDPAFYGILPIKGKIANGTITYVNTHLKSESEKSRKSGYSWYMRKNTVSFNATKNSLTGKWQYPIKNPSDFGELFLAKQPGKRIDPETGISYFN